MARARRRKEFRGNPRYKRKFERTLRFAVQKGIPETMSIARSRLFAAYKRGGFAAVEEEYVQMTIDFADEGRGAGLPKEDRECMNQNIMALMERLEAMDERKRSTIH